MMPAATAAWLVLFVGAAPAAGQDWAQEMFDHTSHDFGTVARGAEVRHTFTVKNIYEEDVFLSKVGSSCRCTTATISQQRLKTWEKAQIEAVVDTRGYTGQKDATLTVTITEPFAAEVRLNVHTFIRGDVVFQPGRVQFGSVPHGQGARRKITVSYAGRSDWQILDVESHNPHLEAKAIETSRQFGAVEYELWVTLKEDAPVGYLNERLVLVTNDFRPRNTRVPLTVEGVVSPSVSVRPSPLLMGVVRAGQPATRRLVVSGETPFRVVSAKSDDARFRCTVPDAGTKPHHLICVTFTADDAPGKLSATIRIETDIAAGETLSVPVHIRVMPAEAGH